jgi:cytochrome P450
VVLEGVCVPPGTRVIALTRIGAIDNENFPSPMMFRPERWLEGETDRDATKRSMFPFGGGPRYSTSSVLHLPAPASTTVQATRTGDSI